MKNEELNLVEVDNDNMTKPVLGILEGPCADIISPTRNGRKYSEKLWEKVFSDPIVLEMIENGGIPGELDHPADRSETDSSRIAILLSDKPEKKQDGKLWARFKILNTPLGKIAYTLAKAGFRLGVSSRGEGDVEEDWNGDEVVNEDTYDFKCFDLVLLPAVKSARLSLVNESLNNNKFNYKKVLLEAIEAADKKDKQLMENTLSNLHISLKEARFANTFSYRYGVHAHPQGNDLILGGSKTLEGAEEIAINQVNSVLSNPFMSNQDKYNYIETVYIADDDNQEEVETNNFADYIDEVMCELSYRLDSDVRESLNKKNSRSNGVKIEESDFDDSVDIIEDDLIDEFQEMLQENNTLKSKIAKLNENLSVCYAKESKLVEEINTFKLTEKKLKKTEAKLDDLKFRFNETNINLNNHKKLVESLAKNFKAVQKNLTEAKMSNKKLIESSKATSMTHASELDELNENVAKLNRTVHAQAAQIKNLNEQLSTAKKDNKLLESSYTKKIEHSNTLVEKYKKTAQNAVNRYIDMQANNLGVSSKEVKQRLPESYSYADIDKAVKELQSYRVSMNRLPFNSLSLNEGARMGIRHQIDDSSINLVNGFGDDDSIDESLLSLAQLK